MKLKNTYYILRHGQTIYQTKKRNFIYPPLSRKKPVIKLTKKGESQIKKAVRKLRNKKIDLILASDIYRTRQTAKIATKELGAKAIFSQKLRDINLGVYHNNPKQKLFKDFPDPKKRFYKGPKKGESWLACQKRIVNFVKEADRKHKGKIILIISHGDPLWLLEGAIKDLSVDKLLKIKMDHVNFIRTGELRKLN